MSRRIKRHKNNVWRWKILILCYVNRIKFCIIPGAILLAMSHIRHFPLDSLHISWKTVALNMLTFPIWSNFKRWLHAHDRVPIVKDRRLPNSILNDWIVRHVSRARPGSVAWHPNKRLRRRLAVCTAVMIKSCNIFWDMHFRSDPRNCTLSYGFPSAAP